MKYYVITHEGNTSYNQLPCSISICSRIYKGTNRFLISSNIPAGNCGFVRFCIT